MPKMATERHQMEANYTITKEEINLQEITTKPSTMVKQNPRRGINRSHPRKTKAAARETESEFTGDNSNEIAERRKKNKPKAVTTKKFVAAQSRDTNTMPTRRGKLVKRHFPLQCRTSSGKGASQGEPARWMRAILL